MGLTIYSDNTKVIILALSYADKAYGYLYKLQNKAASLNSEKLHHNITKYKIPNYQQKSAFLYLLAVAV